MAKISVIVPVYKVEKYLNRCIDSILNQSYTDFDLILVDDGSPDSCGKICDEYAEKDNRITVIHKENGGLSDARNAGLDHTLNNTKCEWLTFIDSDDWVHKNYLEFLYNAATESNCSISMVYMNKVKDYCSDKTEQFSYDIIPTEKAFIDEKGYIAAYSCGRLFSRNLFGDIRFPVGKLWEDLRTTHKLLFQCSDIAVINIYLYYYYYNTDGITLSSWNMKKCSDESSARECLIDFLKSNNYLTCYKQALLDYQTCIIGQMRKITETDLLTEKEKKKNIKLFRKKLKRSLWQSEKTDRTFFNSNKYKYEIVYPKLMWLYWTLKSYKR